MVHADRGQVAPGGVLVLAVAGQAARQPPSQRRVVPVQSGGPGGRGTTRAPGRTGVPRSGTSRGLQLLVQVCIERSPGQVSNPMPFDPGARSICRSSPFAKAGLRPGARSATADSSLSRQDGRLRTEGMNAGQVCRPGSISLTRPPGTDSLDERTQTGEGYLDDESPRYPRVSRPAGSGSWMRLTTSSRTGCPWISAAPRSPASMSVAWPRCEIITGWSSGR